MRDWLKGNPGKGWMPVIFSAECDEWGNCPRCGIDYAECPCPGPTQDDEYEYRIFSKNLWARRLSPAGSRPEPD
jgi:hypothetical protein